MPHEALHTRTQPIEIFPFQSIDLLGQINDWNFVVQTIRTRTIYLQRFFVVEYIGIIGRQ